MKNRSRTFIIKKGSQRIVRGPKVLADLLGILDVGQSLEEAALAQYALPQLHADDAEYEEDEEAQ